MEYFDTLKYIPVMNLFSTALLGLSAGIISGLLSVFLNLNPIVSGLIGAGMVISIWFIIRRR